MRVKGRHLRVGDVIRITLEMEFRVNAPRQGILTPVIPNNPTGFALEIDNDEEVVVLERYPENMERKDEIRQGAPTSQG